LFAGLRQQWTQVTTVQFQQYTQSLSPLENWEDVMRADWRLQGLNLDLVPELAYARRGDGSDGARAAAATIPEAAQLLGSLSNCPLAEFRAMSQLVEIMERAWMQMDLDAAYSHPLQRGWMNCFRRWSSARKFQQYWPVFRAQYSWGFVRFCERVLNVPPTPVHCVRWNDVPDDVQDSHLNELDREFDGEWAEVLTNQGAAKFGWCQGYLRQAVRDSVGSKARPLVWVLTYGRPGDPEKDDAPWARGDEGVASFPVGLVAVRPCPDGGAMKPEDRAGYWELIFWVRGGYRTSEVGRRVLPRLLPLITDAGRSWCKVYLMTRFPRCGPTAAESIQRALWALFFNDHDFYSYRLREDVAKFDVRLRMEFPSGSVSRCLRPQGPKDLC